MGTIIDNWHVFVSGFWVTFQICLLSATGALIVGSIVAILRISPLAPLRFVGTTYVNIFRNTPLTVVMFFTAFALPELGSNAEFLKIPVLDSIFSRLGTDLPYFRFAVLALSLYTAAFVCEAIRAGINAVPTGQAEAARALGLSFLQNLRFVILPQSWRAAIVPLGSVIIAMIKNSALAGFFGVVGDLSQSGTDMVSSGGEPLIPVFIGISVGYLLMTVPLGMLLDRVENKRAVSR